MKKITVWLALLAMLLCLWGCDDQEPTVSTTQKEGVFVFEGTVREVGEDTITVMPDQKYKEAGIAMEIGLLVVKTEVIPDVQVGDRVRIEYDGVVTRSIPGQLGDVYKFEVVS